MRTPIPGMLPPGAVARLTPAPPITETEIARVLSRGGEAAVSMAPDGGSVILTNHTQHHQAYVVVVLEQQAFDSWRFLYERFGHLLPKKTTQP